MRARLTSEGQFVLVSASLAAALGVITGRPAIVGLGALGGVWLAAAWALGWWNLRNLQAVRRLPPDLFADRDAPGALVVRGRGADLHIEEADGSAAVAVSRAEGEEEVPVRWAFSQRGLHHLGGLLVRSEHPFGWIAWSKALDERAEIVVWPAVGRPSGRRGELPVPSPEDEDFVGLRAYRVGDPPRSIHWRTTARAGVPMVALRRGESPAPRWIRVELRAGRPGERELCDAAADVLDAADDGRPVGMILGDDRIEPGLGRGHVRRLLDALAMAVLPESG
jgi:uncharacterized protein (DUF58 family)